MKSRDAFSVVILLLSGLGHGVSAVAAVDAAEVVRSTGIRAGLVVHLDVTDGRLTADLATQGKSIVHGIAATRERAEKARLHIASRGLHGTVSVEQGTLKRLPYVDNLVNLVVVADVEEARRRGLDLDEVKRVLRPGGAAYLAGKEGPPTLIRKDFPADTDEWTHWLHGPEANNVSSDVAAGPAARLQWIDGPIWLTGRGVTELFAAGRSFNVMQHNYHRPQWARIIARDAFNGLVLWQREIDTAGETCNPRVIVAVGDRLYAVVEMNGPLVALDAATGELVRTYDVGFSPESVLFRDGRLVLTGEKEICSVDAATGEVRWRRPAPAGTTFMFAPHKPLKSGVAKRPCVVEGGNRLFVFAKDAPEPPYLLVSFDLATGAEVWRHRQPGDLLAYYEGTVLFYDLIASPTRTEHGKGTYHALSAEDGRELWTRPHLRRSNHPDEPCYAGRLAWISDEVANGRRLNGVDVRTGEEKRNLGPGTWGHCSRLVTTPRYMVGKMTTLVSFETGKHFGLGFYKNGCNVGQLPANGLLYTFPISCMCIAYVRGHVAFASTPEAAPEVEGDTRLDPGPAYDWTPKLVPAEPASWPTYRHDNMRSGSIDATLPRELKVLWSTSVNDLESTPFGKRITPPVIAEGRVLVGAPDAHAVVALDARTGEVRWRYLLDGRAASVPTIDQGRCLFGSSDGWVHCLRASDGELVWRYRAAPADRRLVVRGRLESPWPVPCVMVEKGVAFFAAGRHAKIPDGVLVYAADPAGGRILWTTRVDNVKPETWYDNHVNDLLLSDGTSAFMCQLMFDLRTGEKSRTYFKKKTWYQGRKYKHEYLLSGQGRDTSAVFPFGFSYDRSEGVDLERYQSTYWHYRGATGLVLTFARDRVFGVTPSRATRPDWELFARRFDDPADPEKDLSIWSVKVRGGSVSALLSTPTVLYVAGPGKDKGGVLSLYAPADGALLGEMTLDDVPAFDGLAAADGRLYLSTRDGKVVCLGAK